jgi:glutaredoxin
MNACPTVEILSFEGCPHALAAVALVERTARELGLDVEMRHTDIPDQQAAHARRFLGSPTIRVNDRDIEPGADQRDDYTLACRIYRSARGLTGLPDKAWLRDVLTASQ